MQTTSSSSSLARRDSPLAIVRVEGVLTRMPALASAAFFTVSAQSVRARLSRLSQVALAAPLSLASPLRDDAAATRLGWSALRGMSEDRLHVLGEEWWETQLAPRLAPVGLELVARLTREGRVLLVSEGLDVIVSHLAKRLGCELLCNRMEVRAGVCTGRLLEPLVAGALIVSRLRELGVDVGRASAFASHADDAALLQAVKKPCAVRPDRRLRALARELDFPVMEG